MERLGSAARRRDIMFAVAALCGWLAASAKAQSTGTRGVGPDPMGLPKLRTRADGDRAFASAAALASKFTVISGQLAMLAARDHRLRAFAKITVDDNMAAMEELRAAAREAGIALPAAIAPAGSFQARMEAVRNRRGAAFDRAYRIEQAETLMESEALLESYARSGGHPRLRVWASAMLERVRDHRQRLRQLVEDEGTRR